MGPGNHGYQYNLRYQTRLLLPLNIHCALSILNKLYLYVTHQVTDNKGNLDGERNTVYVT